MTLQELLVKVSSDISGYAAGMEKVSSISKGTGDAMEKVAGQSLTLGDHLNRVGSIAETVGGTLTKIGTALTAAVTLPLVGVGAAALKVAGDLQQNEIAFATMLKSTDAAQEHLNALKEFALKTPFEFTDLVTASKRLQALGFAAKDVIPILTSVGNAAAALGMGAEGIQRITLALGQMQAKGKVQAEEMRQLAEAGIPGWQILAKTLNTDVAGAMKMVEQRAVDSAQAIPALLAGMNERFGGLMEQQSKTLLGQFSNMKDAISFTLQDLGKSLAPTAGMIMENVLTPLLQKVKDLAAGFAMLSPAAQQGIIGVAGLGAAAGPVVLTFGQLSLGVNETIKLVRALPALINPVTLAIGALGTAAALGFYELQKGTATLRSLDAEFSKFITNMVKTGTDFEATRTKLAAALEAGAIGASDYAKAMSMLEDAEKKALGAGWNAQMKEMGGGLVVLKDNAAKAAAAVGTIGDAAKKAVDYTHGLNDAWLQAAQAADTMGGGFQRSIQILENGRYFVESYVGTVKEGADSWAEHLKAVEGMISPTEALNQELHNIVSGIGVAAKSAGGLVDAFAEAAYQAGRITGIIASGLQMFDNAHPEKGGWVMSGTMKSTGGGWSMHYVEPGEGVMGGASGQSESGGNYSPEATRTITETVTRQIDATGIPEAIYDLGTLIMGEFDRLISFLQGFQGATETAAGTATDATTALTTAVNDASYKTSRVVFQSMDELKSALDSWDRTSSFPDFSPYLGAWNNLGGALTKAAEGTDRVVQSMAELKSLLDSWDGVSPLPKYSGYIGPWNPEKPSLDPTTEPRSPQSMAELKSLLDSWDGVSPLPKYSGYIGPWESPAAPTWQPSPAEWAQLTGGRGGTVNVNVYDRSGADSVVRLIQERL